MRTLIRTELLKMRTIRMPYILAAAAAVLTAFVATLMASQAGGSGHMAPPPLDTAAGLAMVISATNFGLILAMVLGAMVSSGEFRHGSATSTYLATPRRNRVVVAKMIAAAAVGSVFGLIAAGVATGVGLGFVWAKGLGVALSGGTIAQYAAGACLGAALLAAIGVGIGSLIRQQVGAVVAVVAWGFGLEQVIGTFVSSLSPYLPFTAAATLAGRSLEAGVSSLPFWAATVLLVGIAASFSLIASRTTLPRDVS